MKLQRHAAPCNGPFAPISTPIGQRRRWTPPHSPAIQARSTWCSGS